jgi:hypothetical protein
MFSINTDADRGYIEFTVDGDVHTADYEAAVAAVDELLKGHDKLDVVEVIRGIGSVDREVWWRDLDFHLHHHHFLRRAAIVTDRRWVAPVVRLFASFYPAEIRFFVEKDLDAARAWAQADRVETAKAA